MDRGVRLDSNHLFSKHDSHSNMVTQTDEANLATGIGSIELSPFTTTEFRKSNWKWVNLSLSCLFAFGSMFCYDSPNALSDRLKKTVATSDWRYNQLYSVYSYPNIILPLLGGVLIDKIGLNFSMVLFLTLLVIGQGVFAISGFIGENNPGALTAFIVAMIGRTIFGMGGEALFVCSNTIISRWFIENQLAFGVGIQTSVSRLGSTANNIIMPPLADATSLGWALMFGLLVCVITWIAGIILTCLESRASKDDDQYCGIKDDEKEEFHWRDIKGFGISFWLITINCTLTYVATQGFNNISVSYFVVKFGMTQTISARITSVIYFVSVFVAPIYGLFLDRVGHKVTFCIISTFTLLISHVLFLVIPGSTKHETHYMGIIPLILFGIGYSIYVVTIWSMIPHVVKPQVVGTAFGICTSLQNLGLSIGPVLVALLTTEGPEGKTKNSYIWVSVALAVCSLFAVLTSILLLFPDKVYHKSILQRPSYRTTYKPVKLFSSPTFKENCKD